MAPGEPPSTSAPPGSARQAAELADEFGRTAKLLGGRLSEQLGRHGLSMPRFSLLVALDRDGPLRLTALGSRVGITQGTASTLVESLVRDGLVERSPDPDDARAARVTITATGRSRARAWRADYERAAEQVFSALPTDQWPPLIAMLRALADGHGSEASPTS